MAYHPAGEAYPGLGLVVGDRRISDSSGGTHAHIYPGSGKATRELPLAGTEEIDAAVSAARAALPDWRRMPAHARRAILNRLADLIDDAGGELERLAAAENGTLVSKAMLFRMGTSDAFRYYAGWVDKIGGDVIPTWPAPSLDYTQLEPYGVIAIILPWNVPLASFGQVVAGALAVGNTVVVKPSELAPFTCLKIGELCLAAGFPPGVVNIVPGTAQAGADLVQHHGVDKIHFTGSGTTARRIIASAGLTPVGLELGGKSARIVFADADRSEAVRYAVNSAISQAGQGCLIGSRLLVERSIYDDVVSLCRAEMENRTVGDPFESGTDMGPLINQVSRERILSMVAEASQTGEATLVSGGHALEGEGYYMAPTLFSDVRNETRLAQEEVFGPVLGITPFEDEADAIRIANQSRYGLGAYLHTDNLRRAHRIASALDVGNVWVNGYQMSASVPFGGNKESGFGRIGGRAGLHEFLRVKNVWMAL